MNEIPITESLVAALGFEKNGESPEWALRSGGISFFLLDGGPGWFFKVAGGPWEDVRSFGDCLGLVYHRGHADGSFRGLVKDL
jgi:hypothetical protein